MKRIPEMEKLPFAFLSGHALKILAIVTMLIDHIGASLLEPAYVFLARNGSAALRERFLERAPFLWMEWMGDIRRLYAVDRVLRGIGRIGFPLFCFLLVEGFVFTHDRRRYAIRLGIFALISDIPFDLAFFGTFATAEHQNVFFTLLFGFLAMWTVETLEKELEEAGILSSGGRWWHRGLRCLAGLFASAPYLIAAHYLSTDYEAIGVLIILILYQTRGNRIVQCILGAVSFLWELPLGPAAFLPVLFYNRKRGKQRKYFFYIFYPAHLLILGLFRRYLGL